MHPKNTCSRVNMNIITADDFPFQKNTASFDYSMPSLKKNTELSNHGHYQICDMLRVFPITIYYIARLLSLHSSSLCSMCGIVDKPNYQQALNIELI